MAANDPGSSEVLRLLEQCLDGLEKGGTSSVDEVLAAHPEHAEAVRKRLELLARAGLIDEDDDAGEAFPETLGDFTLVERVGRGGMGVVYRARQRSLGRDVALKLIGPGHHFFPGARERFRREVEAVAKLDHPGIVAIHLVGEDQSIPYFAMEYVEGASLDQALVALRGQHPEQLSGGALRPPGAAEHGDRPATGLFALGWVDACFTLTLQIGEALAHAHDRGVLHRDIKPSNVMLTPGGTPRVLDFGLARSEGATQLTRSGSQLGSLPYMAPEQIRGDSGEIGPHTDVYALGVLLYELLTLRSPHWADTSERTRQRILEGRPVPIERLNGDVPWDAETVCRTAMDIDPHRRYPSMQAFIDDMRRFVRRAPIHAQRPGLLLRARRWTQRHPARAATVALAGVLVIGGPVLYAVLEHAARGELRVAYEDQRTQRLRADQSLQDAIAAFDEIMRQGSDAGFAAQPGTDQARRDLLERGLSLYEGLLERERDNKMVIERVIRAQARVAEIRRELAQHEAAVNAATRAIQLCEAYRGEDPAAVADLRSEARFWLACALFGAVRREEFHRACADLHAEPTPRDPRYEAQHTLRRGILLRLAAHVLQREAKLDLALEASAEAIAVLEDLVSRHPGDRESSAQLALALQTHAYVAGFHGRHSEYSGAFQRAADLLEEALEADPRAPTPRHRLAMVLSWWAHVDFRRGRDARGVPRARRADEMLAELVDEFPMRESYRLGYLSNAQRLGDAYRRAGDVTLVEARAVASLDVCRAGLDLAQGDSDGLAYQRAILETELGVLVTARGDWSTADEHWKVAEELWRSFLDRPEPKLDHLAQAGAFYQSLAQHEAGLERLETAEPAARNAVSWYRKAWERFDTNEYFARLGGACQLLAWIQIRRDQHDAAVETLRDAVDQGVIDRTAFERPELADGLRHRADYRALMARAPETLPDK